jgi:hypothetical protein
VRQRIVETMSVRNFVEKTLSLKFTWKGVVLA